MRREFKLPAADLEFLDRRYKTWEAILDVNKSQWVIIESFEVPKGYTQPVVAVAIRLDASYPDVQIDMVYFLPGLARIDGKAIRSLTTIPLDGKTWQQWSRHRAQDGWKPGVDNIETHLLYVINFLECELRK